MHIHNIHIYLHHNHEETKTPKTPKTPITTPSKAPEVMPQWIYLEEHHLWL